MHSLQLTRKLTPGQEDALRKAFPETSIYTNGESIPLGSFLRKIRIEKIPLTDSQINILAGLLDSIKFVPGGSQIAS